jgi:putative ATP-dependent endonuclease of OLD family
MRLSKIALQNFRDIPDFDAEVHGHLVLIGANESGKSSLLWLINSLLALPDNQASTAITASDFTEAARVLGLTLTFSAFSDDERAAFPNEITVGPERLVVRLEASFEPATAEVQVTRWFPESGDSRAPSHLQRRMFAWRFVPADRSMYRELDGRRGAMRTLLQDIELGDGEGEIANLRSRMTDVLDASPSLSAFRQDLAKALTEALPRPIEASEVKVSLTGSFDDNPMSSVSVGLTSGDGVASMSEQSDGVRALSSLAVLGLAGQDSSLVGIDEPEMHLHPTAQASIGRLLARRPINRLSRPTHPWWRANSTRCRSSPWDGIGHPDNWLPGRGRRRLPSLLAGGRTD